MRKIKTFVEFISEEPKKQEKIPVIHAHYRSGIDPNHDIKGGPEEQKNALIFYAHYRSGIDPNHDIGDEKPLEENFNLKSALRGPFLDKEKQKFASQFEHQNKHLEQQLREHDGLKDSISEYTGYSRQLNQFLHAGFTLRRSQTQHVENLDRFTNHPKNALKKKLVVYSGISSDFGDAIHKLKPDEQTETKSYLSTTGDPHIANSFAHKSIDPIYHILQIHLPKGYTKARYIPDDVGDSDLHTNPGESEVLLARNQKFRKIKTRTITSKLGATWHIHHLEPII